MEFFISCQYYGYILLQPIEVLHASNELFTPDWNPTQFVRQHLLQSISHMSLHFLLDLNMGFVVVIPAFALWHGTPSSWKTFIALSKKMCWGSPTKLLRMPRSPSLLRLPYWSKKCCSPVRHHNPNNYTTTTKLYCRYNTIVSVSFMSSSLHKHKAIILKEE